VAAQIGAFNDTWHWSPATDYLYQRHALAEELPGSAAAALRALHGLLPEGDTMAYLVHMAPRLVELHRVLKPTGSLYLHCDPTMSHYLKLLLDAVFGSGNFRNEIIWKRSSAHNSAKRYGPVHDVILFYTRSRHYTWNRVPQPLPPETIEQWYNNVEPDTGRKFKRDDLTAQGIRTGPSGQPWRGINPTDKGRHWAIPGFVGSITAGMAAQQALDALDAAGRIFWPRQADGMPRVKRYLEEAGASRRKMSSPTSGRCTTWRTSGSAIRPRSPSRCWSASSGRRPTEATRSLTRSAAARRRSRRPTGWAGTGSASTSRTSPSTSS